MNGTEQRERRDAVRQLRRDLDVVMEEFQDQVRFTLLGFEQQRAIELKKLRAEIDYAKAEAMAGAVEASKRLTEPLRRGIFGRVKWWVTGW